jgi:hypothetical protein
MVHRKNYTRGSKHDSICHPFDKLRTSFGVRRRNSLCASLTRNCSMKGVLPLRVSSLPLDLSKVEYRLGDFSTTFRNDRLSHACYLVYNLFRYTILIYVSRFTFYLPRAIVA